MGFGEKYWSFSAFVQKKQLINTFFILEWEKMHISAPYPSLVIFNSKNYLSSWQACYFCVLKSVCISKGRIFFDNIEEKQTD